VAAASAGCNAEYDSDIDGNFEPLAVGGLKKPGAKATNDDVYKDDELFQDDTAEDNLGGHGMLSCQQYRETRAFSFKWWTTEA
jgi:hypothetical protein